MGLRRTLVDASGTPMGSAANPVQTRSPALALLFTSGDLLAAGAAAASGFVDVSAVDQLVIGRTAAGGAYAFEVDWSRDGAAVDFTEVVAVAQATTTTKKVATAFARFRVRNTDGVAAFTAHRTNVAGR